MRRNISRALLLLVVLFLFLSMSHSPSTVDGYVFDCIDECECDTDDSAIHCHNKPLREQLQLPEKPLRGFIVLGITNNNIKTLPGEAKLLDVFPDLKAVDVECNPNFDCSTLSDYKKIQIMSNCGKSQNDTKCEDFPRPNAEPTEDCDAQCQMKRYYSRLHQYILKLWRSLLKKLNKVRDQNPWIKDIEKWFKDAAKSVGDAANDATKDDGWFTDVENWFKGAADSVKGWFRDAFEG